MTDSTADPGIPWDVIRDQLAKQGITLDLGCCGAPAGQTRVICVTANLADAVEALSRSPRDQVVMVRMDKESVEALDAWVEAGVAKSRSEAAALFLREGLQLRARELSELKGELANVEAARRRLQERAKDILRSGGLKKE